MEHFAELLSGNPPVLFFAAVIAIMILLSFFRNVLRLVISAVAALVIYAAWLQLSGGDVTGAFLHIQQTVTGSVERLGATLASLFELLKFRKQ